MAIWKKSPFNKLRKASKRNLADLQHEAHSSPVLSLSLAFLEAAASEPSRAGKRTRRRLEHVVDAAHGLIKTRDALLVSAVLLRHVEPRQRGKLAKSVFLPPKEVLRLVDVYADAQQKEVFNYTVDLTPDFVGRVHKSIEKERRLIPLFVADYYQHLKELFEVREKARKEGRRLPVDVSKAIKTAAFNGRVFWFPLARAANWRIATGIRDTAFKILWPKEYEKTMRVLPKLEEKTLDKYSKLVKRVLKNEGIVARVAIA